MLLNQLENACLRPTEGSPLLKFIANYLVHGVNKESID